MNVGQMQISEEEDGADDFYDGYGAEVADMKVVDAVLEIGSSGNDLFGSTY